ncbi:MAG: bifunctional 4-hydroxy-2-oxoglutarate aldolase/2-dehydro-3-deoxy-phosphogluconate aldolase [Balneolaceae bacterium]|nr:MAG: bifunctional 4-hydroxy-2-oxoglutarate aldolase/2-dehydro-3-deoxy-phosphogluconate aldolase [Balneolaceae bacterium]
MNRTSILTAIEREKAIAVLRLPDPDLFFPVAEALYKGGVMVLELTMTTPNAVDLIKEASQSFPEEMIIGVGSVMDSKTAVAAIRAGAEFVVSPVIKPDVIAQTVLQSKVMMAGAFTPTEIDYARQLGSDIVKVFPANITGMEFFKAVLAPMPDLKLMPTGGVTLTNGAEWIRAGACAVGVGSALVSAEDLKNRDYKAIEKKARLLMSGLKG